MGSPQGPAAAASENKEALSMLEKPRKCRGRRHPMTAGCTETMAQGTWPPSHPPTAWVCHPGGSLMMRLRPIPCYNSLVLKLKGKPWRPAPPHVLLEGWARFQLHPGSAPEPTACPLRLSLLFCKMRLERRYLRARERAATEQSLAHSKCSIKSGTASVVIVDWLGGAGRHSARHTAGPRHPLLY